MNPLMNPVITEEQFLKLAHTCDSLLQGKDTPVELIAVPWFHIINEVPFLLSEYSDTITALSDDRDLRYELESVYSDIKRAHKRTYEYARLVKDLIRSITEYREYKHKIGLDEKVGRVDVLIVSLLLSGDHLRKQEDFYVGNLQSALHDRGISSIRVLRNYTGYKLKELNHKSDLDDPPASLILPDQTSFREEISYVKRCLKARALLRRLAESKSFKFESRLYKKAADHVVKRQTIKNMRLHSQIEKLCRRFKPSILITLYEGHAWERCVWHAGRMIYPDVFCVGYQHVIFRKLSHSVKRSLTPNSQYDPDLILTVGDITKNILDNSKELYGIPTLTYGTHRRNNHNNISGTPQRMPVFLVLPEGVESESLYLFEFAIQCARILSDVKFILRTHPVLPFERLRPKLKNVRLLPDNIEVSLNGAIEEDFSRASSLIYRGSSTVLYAILEGLKPYYIARENELNFDPIYQLGVWRENVYSVDELVCKFKSDQTENDISRIRKWREAVDYCDKYVMPIKSDAIDKMLALSKSLP